MQDRSLDQLTNVAMIGCAIAALIIFMAGWRSEGASTAFIVCLGFLSLFGLMRR